MTTSQYYTPSIFELLACDKLKDGLREAFRYLLNNLNQSTDFKFILPLPPTDETVLLLDLLIEYSYLRTYRASYAENLYNLIRVSRTTSKTTDSILPSLFCLVVLPYLRHKLDKYFEELHYKETKSASESQRIRIYRLLTQSGSFLNLLCMVRYTAGRSAYHNTIDGLMRVCLKGKLEAHDSDLEDYSLLSASIKNLADILGKTLTLGSYMIQFLDYWNTHSNSAPLFNSSLPIPRPPEKNGLAYTDDRSSNICLICEHVRQNECALSNTGYVFCYGCIYSYVKTNRRCPITGNPTTTENLVKLFTSAPS